MWYQINLHRALWGSCCTWSNEVRLWIIKLGHTEVHTCYIIASEARRARRASLASQGKGAPVQCIGFWTSDISKNMHFRHMVHRCLFCLFSPKYQIYIIKKSDPARPDPTRPDPTRPDPTRPGPTRLDPTRPDATRRDPTPHVTISYFADIPTDVQMAR